MCKLNCINVVKKYPGKTVLNGLYCILEQDTIYGLFGRNGAGKTTLIDLVTGKQAPSGGLIEMDGEQVFNSERAQRRIYSMGERPLFPATKRVRDTLRIVAERYGRFDMEEAYRLCRVFGIGTEKRIFSLSTGQNTLLKLVYGLAVDCPYKFFDEPVLGLDPINKELFYRELLKSYERRPCTMVLSTHQIDEVAHLVERVLILHDGRFLVDDTVENLSRTASAVSGKKTAVEEFTKGKQILARSSLAGFCSVVVKEPFSEKERAAAEQKGIEITGVGLEQLFISLVKPELPKEEPDPSDEEKKPDSETKAEGQPQEDTLGTGSEKGPADTLAGPEQQNGEPADGTEDEETPQKGGLAHDTEQR